MKKRTLLIVGLGALLAVGAFGVTVSAAGDGATIQQMWDACRSGDWQGMADIMRGAAGGTLPCVPADGVSGGCGVGGAGSGGWGGCGGGSATGVLF
jgi:hypothetical protein